MKKKVLAVVGSPRKNGNSVRMVKEAFQAFAEEEYEKTIIYLRDYKYSSCIGCEKCAGEKRCPVNDDMQKIYPILEQAEVLIFASPVYNYNITSWMKSFIDRLYCYYDYSEDRRSWKCGLGKDRPVGLLVVGEQDDPKYMGFTLEAMKLPLKDLEFKIVGELVVTGKFKAGVVKDDETAMRKAYQLGMDLRQHLE